MAEKVQKRIQISWILEEKLIKIKWINILKYFGKDERMTKQLKVLREGESGKPKKQSKSIRCIKRPREKQIEVRHEQEKTEEKVVWGLGNTINRAEYLSSHIFFLEVFKQNTMNELVLRVWIWLSNYISVSSWHCDNFNNPITIFTVSSPLCQRTLIFLVLKWSQFLWIAFCFPPCFINISIPVIFIYVYLFIFNRSEKGWQKYRCYFNFLNCIRGIKSPNKTKILCWNTKNYCGQFSWADSSFFYTGSESSC